MIDVFGSTGFIGSRFCELYSNEIVRVSRECNDVDNKNVLYLISTTDNYNVQTDLHVDINTNLNKLMDVLEQCKNKDITFNFISSWFVYGDGPIPAKEDQPCNPKGFYSITKKCAEDLLVSFCKTFDVKYRILRLCNVYGKGDVKSSNKKNALQFLIDKMKLNQDINLYHNGNFIRDYMHVDDVCRNIKLCIDKGPVNEVINIGTGNPMNFRELIDIVARKITYTGTIYSVEPTKFHKIVQVKDHYMDCSKLQSIGGKTDIFIEDGLSTLF